MQSTQSSKASILAALGLVLGTSVPAAPALSAHGHGHSRSRVAGPRRPAGSKLARKVAKRRLYNPIQ